MKSLSDPMGSDDVSSVNSDGIAFVRARRSMFAHLVPDGRAAALLLCEAVLVSGCDDVAVTRDGDFYAVKSSTDWLSGCADVFEHVVAFPELGANAIHPELVLSAFSTELVTVCNGETRFVVGTATSNAVKISVPDTGRSVIFRLSGDSWPG